MMRSAARWFHLVFNQNSAPSWPSRTKSFTPGLGKLHCRILGQAHVRIQRCLLERSLAPTGGCLKPKKIIQTLSIARVEGMLLASFWVEIGRAVVRRAVVTLRGLESIYI